MENLTSDDGGKEIVDDLPEDVHKKINFLDDSLTEVEDSLKPFLRQPINDIKDKVGDPLENAKLDLMVAYTTNSLFWIYLITQGIDPKTHPIKDELLRIKQYIGRVQTLQEKHKMARLDKNAVKRFVRGALWVPDKGTTETDQSSPRQENTKGTQEDTYALENAIEASSNEGIEKIKKDKKRKRNDDDSDKKARKKKKKKTRQEET